MDVGICDQKLYRWKGNVDLGCELCEGVGADGESAAAEDGSHERGKKEEGGAESL